MGHAMLFVPSRISDPVESRLQGKNKQVWKEYEIDVVG